MLPPPRNPSPVENIAQWRGAFENAEVNALHAECFDHQLLEKDWLSQVNQFSLGWVCTRRSNRLIGFVNVAWDGGTHAFILDAMVSPDAQRRGVARTLIEKAVTHTREAGCEWLHVDFETKLRPFYLDACGFKPTDAGLVLLR